MRERERKKAKERRKSAGGLAEKNKKQRQGKEVGRKEGSRRDNKEIQCSDRQLTGTVFQACSLIRLLNQAVRSIRDQRVCKCTVWMLLQDFTCLW